MSYGQPCRRITTGPLAGPASAYPTFRTPASIRLSEGNEVFAGVAAGRAWVGVLDCAFASPGNPNWAAAKVRVALSKKRRRSELISSDMVSLPGCGKSAQYQRLSLAGSRPPGRSLVDSMPCTAQLARRCEARPLRHALHVQTGLT